MYRIYGKYKNQKRWNACDISNGGWAGNLIYATMFDSKSIVDEAMERMNLENPAFQFEVRKI